MIDQSPVAPAIQILKPNTLSEWLSYVSLIHPKSIAMGLERVNLVRQALAMQPKFPLIIVGGTNGKGSTCAMLEAILDSAGYRVGCYTSPHLLRYNERVRLNRVAISDAKLCEGFTAVESARADVPLTYFEFGTLAAMHYLIQSQVDVAILEVGLGGRLDAVNIFDPDCSIITSVDLDHMDYLGDTREKIGFEKAGICRKGKPVIYAAFDAPRSVVDYAQALGAHFLQIGKDFGFNVSGVQWQYWSAQVNRPGLPLPALRGDYQLSNASACIAALEQLKDRVPVEMNAIRAGLVQVELPGRFQVIPGRPLIILDVAHNPHAARALATNLDAMQGYGKTYAVFSMLKDKDIAGLIDALKSRIDFWLIAGIAENRGADVQRLHAELTSAAVAGQIIEFDSVKHAFMHASNTARENDRIIVFGSFLTVADVMRELQRLSAVVT